MNLTSMSDKVLGKLPGSMAAPSTEAPHSSPGCAAGSRRSTSRCWRACPASRSEPTCPPTPNFPPSPGRRDEILADLAAIAAEEEADWSEGRASGAVYHGDADHIDFLNQVYALQSQSNPLHVDLWPSGMKFEAEVVAMTAGMLGAAADRRRDRRHRHLGRHRVDHHGDEDLPRPGRYRRTGDGAARLGPRRVRQGGAVLRLPPGAGAGRRRLRRRRRRDGPGRLEADRRGGRLGTRLPPRHHRPHRRALGDGPRAGIGFHTDACLGGFVLPWAEQLGYDVPRFDFRLPGVTSMSADTHKYGYAAKGTSVVLYRGRELRHHQYYVATDWPGGLYFSPTLAGSRPGALLASAWAAMLSMGEEGYCEGDRRHPRRRAPRSATASTPSPSWRSWAIRCG